MSTRLTTALVTICLSIFILSFGEVPHIEVVLLRLLVLLLHTSPYRLLLSGFSSSLYVSAFCMCVCVHNIVHTCVVFRIVAEVLFVFYKIKTHTCLCTSPKCVLIHCHMLIQVIIEKHISAYWHVLWMCLFFSCLQWCINNIAICNWTKHSIIFIWKFHCIMFELYDDYSSPD